MLPIFVKNRTVAFSTTLTRLSGRTLSVDPEDLLTPWGYFIPSDSMGFSILEWMRYGRATNLLRVKSTSGILIDHRGDIHEFKLDAEDRVKDNLDRFSIREGTNRLDICGDVNLIKVNRDYIPAFEGLKYVLCSVGDFEVDAIIALDVGKTLPDVVDLYMKRSMVQTATYVTLDIDNIKQVLIERGLTKTIPTKWVTPMSEEEIKEFDEFVEKEKQSRAKPFKVPDHIAKELDE